MEINSVINTKREQNYIDICILGRDRPVARIEEKSDRLSKDLLQKIIQTITVKFGVEYPLVNGKQEVDFINSCINSRKKSDSIIKDVNALLKNKYVLIDLVENEKKIINDINTASVVYIIYYEKEESIEKLNSLLIKDGQSSIVFVKKDKNKIIGVGPAIHVPYDLCFSCISKEMKNKYRRARRKLKQRNTPAIDIFKSEIFNYFCGVSSGITQDSYIYGGKYIEFTSEGVIYWERINYTSINCKYHT
ncbi:MULTISPECIES: hypothetical protein [unclassified Bacillus (in: firmicutes)]|uniref:Uncharacterized protein n=1 Tax=Bacillus mycoides TaxID=1405 RepID=A0A3D9TXF2_BACMY|nr:hypothetical protein [Bacillus sp. DB-2]RBP17107.1 hypothetical protein DET63_13012 [Bacillus sp. DB-2]REF18424.1 hypothetical protein DET55_14033 [Bacillus mycoides]